MTKTTNLYDKIAKSNLDNYFCVAQPLGVQAYVAVTARYGDKIFCNYIAPLQRPRRSHYDLNHHF